MFAHVSHSLDTTRECPEYKDGDLVPPLELCIRTRSVSIHLYVTLLINLKMSQINLEKLRMFSAEVYRIPIVTFTRAYYFDSSELLTDAFPLGFAQANVRQS